MSRRLISWRAEGREGGIVQVGAVLDVDDEDGGAARRQAAIEAGARIAASLRAGAAPLSGELGAALLRITLPRPAERLWPLIANLDITNMSALNDALVGNEFRMSTYLPDDEGFVGPDGQILCQWTELVEPSRVAMTWAWMRTLPDARIEDRLPCRARLTVALTPGTEPATTDVDLLHDDIPVEWVADMIAVWMSKVDQWAYQSRPPRHRIRPPTAPVRRERHSVIELPGGTVGVPVLRTDFSDSDVWARLREGLLAEDHSGSGYEPNLEFFERPDLSDLAEVDLDAVIPRPYPSAYEQPFLVVVDATAVSSAEHHVLLVDLSEQDTSPSFRALPREIAAIEANLSIANMDFFEFGDNTDDDGVFRGFG